MKNILPETICGGLRRMGTMWAAICTMALIAGTVMLPGNSEACCFYNKTDAGIEVSFSCGIFCGNYWDIKPGGHACRPGKGGYATGIRKDRGMRPVGDSCSAIKVAKHGWVEVHHVSSQGLNKGVVESKDENGNTTQTCTFDWDD